MLLTSIKEHDQQITANLTQEMDQKLASELNKKDQENERAVKEMKDLTVSETIKAVESKKDQEISLYWNKIPEPEEEKKEKKIIKNLEEKNISYKFFKGNILSEHDEVTK